MGISYQPEPSGEPNEQLAAEIRARLQDQARVHADRIAVEVRGNTAVLTGVAADRYERTRAEELAAEVQGIESVANHIAIQPQDESGGPLLTTRTGGEDIEPTTQRS